MDDEDNLWSLKDISVGGLGETLRARILAPAL